MEIAKGNLYSLMHKKDVSDFWQTKFTTLKYNINYNDLLSNISFEYKTSTELFNEILVLLFKHWGINKGTELQFLRSLFYNVFIWSKNRITVTNTDIIALFQDIKDSYSKAPVNNAILKGQIAIEMHDTTPPPAAALFKSYAQVKYLLQSPCSPKSPDSEFLFSASLLYGNE